MTRAHLILFLAAFALPAWAQDNIIVVPLEPVNPTEVQPGTTDNVMDPFGVLEPLNPGEVIGADPLADPATLEPAPIGSVIGEDVTTVQESPVEAGTGAVLFGLDKLAGTSTELALAKGETAGLGWLQITLGECRYPVDNPAGDAFAWLVIREEAGAAPVFEGWMIASSPALNALDHARYDVWVSHCKTE